MAGKKMPARMKKTKQVKEPMMTKKQWITLGVCVAVAVVALIAFFVLRDMFDGSLKVVDDAVQAEENWIFANTGTSSRPKYFKLGEIEPAEGYTLERQFYGSDERVPTFLFYPEGESPVKYISLLPASEGAKAVAEKVAASYGSFYTGAVTGEVTERQLAGHSGWGFDCVYESGLQLDETSGEGKPGRTLNLYFDAPRGLSILISATSEAEDAALVADEATLLALMEPIARALTIGDAASD
jgi:hypothetical protein